jgi:hypothetical protein
MKLDKRQKALRRLWTIFDQKGMNPQIVKLLKEKATVEQINEIYYKFKKEIDDAIESNINRAQAEMEAAGELPKSNHPE